MTQNIEKVFTKNEIENFKITQNESYTFKFNQTKFKKYTLSIYLLNDNDIENVKNYKKTMQNLSLANYVYFDNDNETFCKKTKITKYHLNIFKENLLKITTSEFEKVIASFDNDTLTSILQLVVLNNSKQKNVTTCKFENVVAGAMALAKAFICHVATLYNDNINNYLTQQAKNNNNNK